MLHKTKKREFKKYSGILGLALAGMMSFTGVANAAEPAKLEITAADTELVKSVSDRLVAAVKTPPEDMAWPPTFQIDGADQRNAYATFRGRDDAGKRKPLVMTYKGTLKDIVKGSPDRLAFVMGHELAHIILNHPVANPDRDKTAFLETTYTRTQETDADRVGMELLLAAGYSFDKSLGAIKTWIKDFPNDDYSSFEGVGVDHPSWKDRITLLDKNQAKLWKAMSAFQNGVVFLKAEQYPAAISCFERVTKDFPQSYEAYANLGYARLMLYCDAMDPADVRRYDIGQIVVGGFYQRPSEIEERIRVGSLDEDLWILLVDNLKDSLRLQPNQALVNANLGIAYLVRARGKDAVQAAKFFDTALTLAEADKSLDNFARSALNINAGVVEMGGAGANAKTKLDTGEQFARTALAGRGDMPDVISNALLYNRAMLLTRSTDAAERRSAISQWEKYLLTTSPASAWWPLAYEQYEQLSKKTGVTVRSKEALGTVAQAKLRLTTSVDIGQDRVITLSDSLADAQKILGPGQAVLVAGKNLERISYANMGVDLLSDGQVLAVFLSGPNAPALNLRGTGLGGETKTLRVGMTQEELEKILGEDNYDFTQFTDPDINYRFWRNVGVAARVKGGIVQELVVVRVPQKRTFGA
ncbi:MAG TPA: M48 family metallopeptidase [Abditibacteriaceae bacterium]|jgi:tetratricopeptide (TPR) repeat protein